MGFPHGALTISQPRAAVTGLKRPGLRPDVGSAHAILKGPPQAFLPNDGQMGRAFLLERNNSLLAAAAGSRKKQDMSTNARIHSIYRYPVKGLSPEQLPQVALSKGRPLPNDRRYAIENGPSGFDPADPKYFPKSYFLMLMRDERLAALRTHFDDDSHVLTIRHDGAEVRANLETAEGREAIEAFFRAYCARELKGPPRILSGGDHSFSDVAKKVVSIINLASVMALEDLTGQPVDPLRFRGNLYVSGWPAWSEFELVGRTLAAGGARLGVTKVIGRCAAINVDPVTAARDLNLPQLMMQRLGHMDCGIYAEVAGDGRIATGDVIVESEPALL